MIRLRKRGKLGPRYIGPFRIVARVGKVAYRLELPEELSRIHNTFYVSQLRKCVMDQEAVVLFDPQHILCLANPSLLLWTSLGKVLSYYPHLVKSRPPFLSEL